MYNHRLFHLLVSKHTIWQHHTQNNIINSEFYLLNSQQQHAAGLADYVLFQIHAFIFIVVNKNVFFTATFHLIVFINGSQIVHWFLNVLDWVSLELRASLWPRFFTLVLPFWLLVFTVIIITGFKEILSDYSV